MSCEMFYLVTSLVLKNMVLSSNMILGSDNICFKTPYLVVTN